jgi:hypothetical protein
VGESGDGKSSTINAVLGEENFVATSNSRACTAVATEISWNYSEEDNKRYRAEIEYISRDDWQKELAILAHDLLDVDGEYGPSMPTAIDAAVALDKIRAVYGNLGYEEISARLKNIDEMVQEDPLNGLLGTIKELNEPNANRFRDSLRPYISSMGRYWPLIKVVKKYIKASALKSGIVLVDLLGAQDCNTARSAVAENYVKQC